MTRLLILSALVAASLSVQAADDPIAALKKGQPKSVADLIDRIVECNHWGGEEAYDADRRLEIKQAMVKLRCDTLDVDEAKILKSFDGNAKVAAVVKAAKNLYL